MIWTRPLDRFPLADTCDLDEMRAVFAHMYTRPTIQLMGRNGTFRTIINCVQISDIKLNYGLYTEDLRMEFPETEFVSQMFPIVGKGEAVVGSTSVAIAADYSAVISASEPLNIAINAGYERLVLRINSTALTNKLSALTATSINGPLKFQPASNDTRPAAKALRDHFFFLVDKLNTSAELPKLVLAEFEQTLMVMFLHANQHNYSYLLERASRQSAPRQVRQAEEYIEANWQQAITLEGLAEVTGVSALGLFRSFKKIRGYSPMEFANRVRLSRARELLRRPDATTTVATVASTCGFADLDGFDSDYLRAFSELPSTTLNRSAGIDPARQ